MMYNGRIISVLFEIGLFLLVINILPYFGGRFYTDRFWGKISGLGFILTGVFLIILPEFYIISIILGLISVLLTIYAFLANVMNNRVR